MTEPDPVGPIIPTDRDDALLLHFDLVKAGARPHDRPLDLIDPAPIPRVIAAAVAAIPLVSAPGHAR